MGAKRILLSALPLFAALCSRPWSEPDDLWALSYMQPAQHASCPWFLGVWAALGWTGRVCGGHVGVNYIRWGGRLLLSMV